MLTSNKRGDYKMNKNEEIVKGQNGIELEAKVQRSTDCLHLFNNTRYC